MTQFEQPLPGDPYLPGGCSQSDIDRRFDGDDDDDDDDFDDFGDPLGGDGEDWFDDDTDPRGGDGEDD